MKVGNPIFLANFLILDYEVDFEVLIILDRLFLATKRVPVDTKSNELKFKQSKIEVKFNMC